jgi:hypothetical protein
MIRTGFPRFSSPALAFQADTLSNCRPRRTIPGLSSGDAIFYNPWSNDREA